MLDFHPIRAEDRPVFQEFLLEENTQNSSLSFGNVYLWSLLCRRSAARHGERLCLEFLCPSGAFYAFPFGRGPLAPAIGALREHAAACGRPLTIKAVTQKQLDALEAEFPGAFDATPDPNNYDYIYDIGALATLAGKKLHGKRNHCNRFELAYPGWRCEPLSPALFGDCREILRFWDREKSGGDADENNAIEEAFRQWDRLDMLGCVLYAQDRPVAFTFGEIISPDTFDTHFEKALDTVEGAYPMICRELARQLRSLHPELNYVNREEDMGLPGLRKAKNDWYPLYQEKKYNLRWREGA